MYAFSGSLFEMYLVFFFVFTFPLLILIIQLRGSKVASEFVFNSCCCRVFCCCSPSCVSLFFVLC